MSASPHLGNGLPLTVVKTPPGTSPRQRAPNHGLRSANRMQTPRGYFPVPSENRNSALKAAYAFGSWRESNGLSMKMDSQCVVTYTRNCRSCAEFPCTPPPTLSFMYAGNLASASRSSCTILAASSPHSVGKERRRQCCQFHGQGAGAYVLREVGRTNQRECSW